MTEFEALHLGKASVYASHYDASLLSPIPRSLGRCDLNICEQPLPFDGVDLWTAYEISWLDMSGKPQLAIGEFMVPCVSTAIFESKSLKLYLNSLNQSKYSRWSEVINVIETDLSACAGSPVLVRLFSLDSYQKKGLSQLPGICVDGIESSFEHYLPQSSLLELDDDLEVVTESLYSHVLKTNCPVTGQPDWASVLIQYTGRKIRHESILQYLVSFRDEQGFHEQCVERIYTEIMQRCAPEKLSVYARYTRRGGIDINPLRSNVHGVAESFRLSRQ